MKAENIQDVIKCLDAKQDRLWDLYYIRDDGLLNEMSKIFDTIDEINAERKRLVGYHLSMIGPLPTTITDVY